MTDVALVGMGPWGLAVLERLVTGALARRAGAPDVTVHVIEPGTPGSGVYGGAPPDYLILNTPCGQHSMYPYPSQAAGRRATGFHEWAVASGYQWVGERCEVTTRGRAITPHDFLPRRLMGEYLAWFYRCLVQEAPDGFAVVHHRTSAVAVEPAAGHERVRLVDGSNLEVDHVVVTTGHTPNTAPSRSLLAPYPVTALDRTVPPGSSLGVQGMGLVALDVVTALTTGRGGRFVRRDGHLRYRPSGREPRIAMFSRSGTPYCAKSMGTADITGEFRPVICTPEAATGLRFDAAGARRPVDARTDLLPLVFAEMTVCFYAQSARLAEGPGAAPAVAERLGEAWRRGRFDAAVSSYAARYGDFDAGGRYFAGEDAAYVSAKDYQSRVADLVESDVAAAVVPNGASPLKLADEILRPLRDTVRAVVEFGGLTPASHRDFQVNLRNRFARMVAGPPVHRSEQLLALMDAEIVRTPFGPCPEVALDDDGAVIGSRHLDRHHAERVDRVVAAHIDQPTVHDSASPLLGQLFGDGRVRQFRVDGEELGSIDLTEDFHPLGSDGTPQDRLWIFGALTEGVRYYTAYIPSPSSRVRAFLDAQRCADSVLEGS
ncbi:MAG: FAD/NAD(P)-binding protein [Acidimicrobiales bacterium]